MAKRWNDLIEQKAKNSYSISNFANQDRSNLLQIDVKNRILRGNRYIMGQVFVEWLNAERDVNR